MLVAYLAELLVEVLPDGLGLGVGVLLEFAHNTDDLVLFIGDFV